MSEIPPPPPGYFSNYSSQLPGPVTPVDNWTRFGAFLLEVLLMVVTCGIGWLVWSVVLWQQSTTPAKKIMKLKVVDLATGGPAVMQQMVMRELVGKVAIGVVGNMAFVSLLGDNSINVGGIVAFVSGILILAKPTRQGVWDYIAKTTVVRAG